MMRPSRVRPAGRIAEEQIRFSKKKSWRSKNTVIDVTLHADSIFEFVFDRTGVEPEHLKAHFLQNVFLQFFEENFV